MEEINDMLELAREYGLESEVVLSALEAMKENSDHEPIEALMIGCADWDIP